MLFTVVAQRRRTEAWREKASRTADQLYAWSQQAWNAGDRARATHYIQAAIKALAYVARCDRELARLG